MTGRRPAPRLAVGDVLADAARGDGQVAAVAVAIRVAIARAVVRIGREVVGSVVVPDDGELRLTALGFDDD